MGFNVFPLKPNSKEPALRGWQDAATQDEEQIHIWWSEEPSANIGILCGFCLVVLDVDIKGRVDGEASLAKLEAKLGQLPPTLTVETPSGGYHLYFKIPDDAQIRNSASKHGAGLDIRGKGGYVAGAGSSINGKRYRRVGPVRKPQSLPPRWLEFLTKPPKKRLKKQRQLKGKRMKKIRKGKRNDTLFALARRHRDNGGLRRSVRQQIVRINEGKCSPPLPDDEIETIIRSVFSRSPRARATDEGAIDNDTANADRIVAAHGDDLIFSPGHGWLFFDGRRFALDTKGHVTEIAKDVARSLYDEAKRAEFDDQQRICAWARQSQNKGRISAAKDLASSDPKVRKDDSDLDADPFKLTVLNGTFDLEEGSICPHKRSDLITRLAPTEFDEQAECPLWEEFLDRVFASDAELISFVQRALGYSLTGNTREQVLFFCYGTGANGKTVFLEVAKSLLGDYALAAAVDTLTQRGGGSIRNDVARLAGARFVAVGETAKFGRLDESLVKDLTGGDTVTARFLHKEFFDFRPQFKLWMRGNHKPKIEGTDDGIWRRICLIPFKVRIPANERDKQLYNKLLAELPGILAWAVRGCADWQRDGLNPPTVVRQAVRKYRNESDVVGRFLKDTCRESKSGTAPAGHLFDLYKEWCSDNGERFEKAQEFKTAMEERGIGRKRRSKGLLYLGIEIR